MKAVDRESESDQSTQTLLATLRDHFGSVNCVRWAKHGRYVASGSDDQVILIHERKPGSGTTEFGSGEPPDVENWKVTMTLRGHTADVVIECFHSLINCFYLFAMVCFALLSLRFDVQLAYLIILIKIKLQNGGSERSH